MLHVCCVRTGRKYSRDYVAILHDMVSRNLSTPHHFWCLTDDPESIHPEIGIIPADPELKGWWQKVNLFNPHMPWKPGEDRVLYFDLDVAIVGRLEEMAETPGIIRDWNNPEYNSSVMCWDAGDHLNAWLKFNPIAVPIRMHGDQNWLTELGGWETFPRDWCLSFRAHAQDWPPNEAKVVVFHGEPKPHEVQGWVKDVWKIGGHTQFLAGKGMNVSYAKVLENVRINSAREDVQWFVGDQPHKETLVIVGGAPSLKEQIRAIRDQRLRGSKILALNNACAFLNANNIVPDYLMICDAREENVVFTRAEAKRYILASQCDPSLFDALKGKDVHMPHLWVCDEMRDILAPYDETQPICLIGGGSTVGLRAISLGIISGYRTIHLYGMDSCFSQSQHHAYEQTLNDADQALEVYLPALKKHYVVSPWMARQAAEFRDIVWQHAKDSGTRIIAHGKGLIPDMARHLAQNG